MVSTDSALTLLLIQAIAIATHIIPFALFPVEFATHPMTYMGKHGLNEGLISSDKDPVTGSPHGTFAMRGFSCWMTFVCGINIALYKEGAASSNIMLAESLFNFVGALYFFMCVFGFDGGDYLATKPTWYNKMNFMGWFVFNTFCGIFFMLAVDFDAICQTSEQTNSDLVMATLLIMTVLPALHILPFILYPVKFMSHPLVYMGSRGAEFSPHGQFGFRVWACFLIAWVGIQAAIHEDGGAPNSVWLVLAISNYAFALFFFTAVFGFDDGSYLATRPNVVNKVNMGSWVLICGVVATIFLFEYLGKN